VRHILLVGALFNLVGGLGILLSMRMKLPLGFAELPPDGRSAPPDYVQFRVFTAGAAFTFSAMYYYLYRNPEYAMPFLLFGTALKYWAFLASLFAHVRHGLPRGGLIAFGVSNLCVALLFTLYLLA
jgi:hypothetical protein